MHGDSAIAGVRGTACCPQAARGSRLLPAQCLGFGTGASAGALQEGVVYAALPLWSGICIGFCLNRFAAGYGVL